MMTTDTNGEKMTSNENQETTASEALVVHIMQDLIGSEIHTESRPGLMGDVFYISERVEMAEVVQTVLKSLYEFLEEDPQLPAVIRSSLPWEVEVSPVNGKRLERHFRTVGDGVRHVEALTPNIMNWLKGLFRG